MTRPARFEMRCSDDELRAWRAHAKRQGRTLSQHVRWLLLVTGGWHVVNGRLQLTPEAAEWLNGEKSPLRYVADAIGGTDRVQAARRKPKTP